MKTTKLLTAVLVSAALAAPAAAQAAPKKHTKPTVAASSQATALSQVLALAPGARSISARGRQWTYADRSGQPGAVLAVSQVNAILTRVWAGPTVRYINQLTIMNGAGVTVGRSPATNDAQHVVVLYVLQSWNGDAWVNGPSKAAKAVIPVGYSATRTAALHMQPTRLRGAMRVITGVFNYTPGGTLLGASVIVPNTADDQICRVSRCLTYNGYLQFG